MDAAKRPKDAGIVGTAAKILRRDGSLRAKQRTSAAARYTETMPGLGRSLIVLGGLLILAGFCVVVLGRLHLPLGRLPGDIHWRGKNSSVYFPLTTCLLLSAIASLVLYVIGRLRH
jgi:hypothetical protein